LASTIGGFGIPSWADPGFRQVYGQSGSREFRVHDSGADPTSDTWQTLVHRERTSFDIHSVGSATKDVFCLAGFASNADFVLERWELVPATGPDSSAPETSAWPRAHGLVHKAFQRTVLHRGPLAKEVVSVEADPEDRFVIAELRADDGTVALYRFACIEAATPELLWDSTMLPELEQAESLQRFQHALFGRVWFLSNRTNHQWEIALVDADNDGSFDGPPLVGDPAFFDRIGFGVWDEWDPLLGPLGF
jgi:hypothetical protein